MIWIKATTLKEIFWQEKNYPMGTKIIVTEEDARILRNAGVIGNLRKFREEDLETAVRKAPETAKRNYKKRNK